MATKKDKIELNGITTLEVNEEIIGKIKKWDVVVSKEVGEVLTPLWVTPATLGKETTLKTSTSLSELWFSYTSEPTNKSVLGKLPLHKFITSGNLYVKTQLEMWGVEKGSPISLECLNEIVITLEDMGYSVRFDVEASPDSELIEELGATIQEEYKFNYVTRQGE